MTDTMARAREIAEKLRARVDSGQRTIGGGSIGVSIDGKTTAATMWGNEPIMVYRNPDGPDAANLIEELARALTSQRTEVIEACARVAAEERAKVAKFVS